MLCVTPTDLQYSVNAFDVNCDPWSLWRIGFPFILGWDSNAFFSVLIAKSLVMFRSVILAITARSCRSIIVQLYRISLLFKNRYVKSVHHFCLISFARKSWLSLFEKFSCVTGDERPTTRKNEAFAVFFTGKASWWFLSGNENPYKQMKQNSAQKHLYSFTACSNKNKGNKTCWRSSDSLPFLLIKIW